MELRNLRVHPDNGSWSLSEPTIPSNMTSTLDGGPLKHLAWSPTGCDLAIVDAAGRITIATIFASLNKPTMTRLGSVDPADELHSIVGSYWLNVAPFPQNKPVCTTLICLARQSLTHFADHVTWTSNQRGFRLQIRGNPGSRSWAMSSKSLQICFCMSDN